MNAHEIVDGKIVNTIVVDSLDALKGRTLIDAAVGGKIGDGWVNGALIPAAAPAAVVPDRVPMLNAHLVLIEAGWMPQVEAFIDAMPEPNRSLARAYLVQSLTMARDHDLVRAIPTALNKTEAEVDALFIKAGAMNV